MNSSVVFVARKQYYTRNLLSIRSRPGRRLTVCNCFFLLPAHLHPLQRFLRQLAPLCIKWRTQPRAHYSSVESEGKNKMDHARQGGR